jgi:hypothetical protein
MSVPNCAHCGKPCIAGSVGRPAYDPDNPWKQERICFDCWDDEQKHNRAIADAEIYGDELDCDCRMCTDAEFVVSIAGTSVAVTGCQSETEAIDAACDNLQLTHTPEEIAAARPLAIATRHENHVTARRVA